MKQFVYVSSWTHGEPDAGVGVYEFDEAEGKLTFIDKVEDKTAFDVMVIDKEKSLLYAVNEASQLPGLRGYGGGQIFTFAIDKESGRLTKLGSKPTWCNNPCYIGFDKEKKFAVVSNHGGSGVITTIGEDTHGNYVPQNKFDDVCVELFAVNEDGTIGELLDVVKHQPSSFNPNSHVAHPHCAVPSPDGSMFAVCDKGNDTVRMYKIDRDAKKLYLDALPFRAGIDDKPRYAVFSKDGRYFYHNNEGSLEMCAYSYNADGKLTPIGKVNVLPDGYVMPKDAPAPGAAPGPGGPRGNKHEQQGLCINPNGKIIYDVVHGSNHVCVLEICEDGSLKKIQDKKVDDTWPRGCSISEDGKYFAVCGLKGGKVFIYPVNEDGTLGDPICDADQNCAAYAVFLQI